MQGVPDDAVGPQTEALLSRVQLADVGNVRAGNYSGGMKRRLSVAIALLGNPAIVYLDEVEHWTRGSKFSLDF